MNQPFTIHADVTYHHGPLGWVVVAKLTTTAANTRTAQRRLSAAMYRVAAELETSLADGSAPDGDCLGYTVDVRGPHLEMGLSATVRLLLTDGDQPVDVAYAEELVIEACVACGIEPEHAGSGPLDRDGDGDEGPTEDDVLLFREDLEHAQQNEREAAAACAALPEGHPDLPARRAAHTRAMDAVLARRADLAAMEEGPCPECHKVGAHEGICRGPAR